MWHKTPHMLYDCKDNGDWFFFLIFFRSVFGNISDISWKAFEFNFFVAKEGGEKVDKKTLRKTKGTVFFGELADKETTEGR